MEKNIDGLVEHIISNEELENVGIECEDLGIRIRMVDAEEIYLTKKGISIRTKEKYLSTNDLKEYISKNERQNQKESYFDNFTP
ncbi:MAG: hypothetical protein KJ583_07045 [Nanoarchaeota archaeon]|nr:hypothetical protein [Nanoarchaeota archaeon]MBU1269198.1 hypothetical protein [Nanoarchaeota archaeon]MBU1605042.1 hypothetical protein [Nanoarchaeota archaeon]MBU2442879.1 hypothetical protein [Nanoarchaeota archaeon]